jgi:ribokinase
VFLSQFEAPVAAVQAGLETARRHGVTTILNPAPAISGDPALVSLCDYVTPNETEAGMLTGRQVEGESDALAAADELLRRGARNVVVTRGEHGVLLHGAVGTHRVPAFRVDQVVDTTGAGDAFNGGFATALAEGLSPVEAARFGCATAALSVTRHGAASAMPHRHEIEAMLGR